MVESITSQRGLEILQALKAHDPISLELEELDAIEAEGLIHHRPLGESGGVIQAIIEQLKEQYSTKLAELHELRQQYRLVSCRYHSFGLMANLLAYLQIGPKARIGRTLKEHHTRIETVEQEFFSLKTRLFGEVIKRDADYFSYSINNAGYQITPNGDMFTSEIQHRPRYLDQNLTMLKEYLEQIDRLFRQQIADIQGYISHRKFTPILLPYLNHLKRMQLVRVFDGIAARYDPNYPTFIPEQEMMRQIIWTGYDFGNIAANPSFSPHARVIEQVKGELRKIFHHLGNITPNMDIVFQMIAQALVLWAYHRSLQENRPFSIEGSIITEYLGNLYQLVDHVKHSQKTGVNTDFAVNSNEQAVSRYDGLQFGGFQTPQDQMALMLLAFAAVPSKFNYFLSRVNHGVHGGKFFAAVLSLLPWTAEETWILLKRAEAQILMAQSVQFIPELLEYGLILNLNPDLLAYIGGVSSDDLNFWTHVIIPAVAAVNVFSLDEEIANYVQIRPLAYITNPRPYYYHHGFYRRHYWFGWRARSARSFHPIGGAHSIRPHIYRRNYIFSHRAPLRTAHRTSMYSSGGPRHMGARYSSLHHHTIG